MSGFYDQRVTYDRSARAYVVSLGGDRFTYPPGREGRAVAMRAAVLDADPDLWAAVRRFTRGRPWLSSRAWAAAELLLSGRVLSGGLIEGEGGAYELEIEDGVLTCECYDFEHWGAPVDEDGRRLCKHIIAWLLAQEVYSNE